MSTLVIGAVRSNSSSPPTFQNTSGTEIGRLCRAFVNFNGTGTVAINGQFNVSSITDNGTGDYTINFTTAMPDANYVISFAGDVNTSASANDARALNLGAPATGSQRIYTGHNYTSPVGEDWQLICVSFFR